MVLCLWFDWRYCLSNLIASWVIMVHLHILYCERFLGFQRIIYQVDQMHEEFVTSRCAIKLISQNYLRHLTFPSAMNPIFSQNRSFVFETFARYRTWSAVENLGIGHAIDSPGQAVRRRSPKVFGRLLPTDPVCFEPHPIQLAN